VHILSELKMLNGFAEVVKVWIENDSTSLLSLRQRLCTLPF
jgi:hypothetical protein